MAESVKASYKWQWNNWRKIEAKSRLREKIIGRKWNIKEASKRGGKYRALKTSSGTFTTINNLFRVISIKLANLSSLGNEHGHQATADK